MRKILFLSMAVLFMATSVASADLLTDDQMERLNQLGAPRAINSSFRTELGDVLDAVIGGGGRVSVAADTLAMPVVDSTNGRPVSMILKTTGSDAEAGTLADGQSGQILTIHLDIDGGGDLTVTPATSGGGFANCVLADAGDTVTWKFVGDDEGWVVLGATGVSDPVCAKS